MPIYVFKGGNDFYCIGQSPNLSIQGPWVEQVEDCNGQ